MFSYWQCRFPASVLTLGFFPGNADAVIQRAFPCALRYPVKALDFIVTHELSTLVTCRNESEVVIQLPQCCSEFFLKYVPVGSISNLLPVVYFGITFQNFETHPYFMDAIINSFQLGGLVYDIFRGSDLAAIVQPAGDLKGLPVFFREIEISEWLVFRHTCGLCEHSGDLRYALAVAPV